MLFQFRAECGASAFASQADGMAAVTAMCGHGGLRASRRSALFVVLFVPLLAVAANAAASRLVPESGVVERGTRDGMERGVGRDGRRVAGQTRY